MKKLIILLLFIPIVSFGQDVNLNVDKKVEFTEKRDIKGGDGLNYQGSGLYTFTKLKKGSSYKPKYERISMEMEAELVKEIIKFTARNNYNYKIISVEKIGNYTVRLIVTFKVFNKDGSLVINKNEAKKELLELKEYLDLGIITQEEFDTKAVSLKKILLGN